MHKNQTVICLSNTFFTLSKIVFLSLCSLGELIPFIQINKLNASHQFD